MPTLFTMNADVYDFISPELVGSGGLRINFDLNVNGLLKVGDTIRPSLMAYRRVVGFIRSDGRLYDKASKSAAPYDIDDPGNLGVRLLANDPDLNLDGDVTYKVSGYRYITGDLIDFGPYETLAVPADDTEVDLAEYVVPELGAMPETSNSLIQSAVDQYVLDNADNIAFDDFSLDGTELVFSRQGVEVGRTDLTPAIPSSNWDTIANKPTVIGAGASQADARTAIGAGTASTKTDVGLGNVDNTSDADKPVSTATQAALDAAGDTATWAGVAGAPSHLTTGVVGDGTTDDLAALASSDSAAVSASLPLMLLPGVYRVATDLTITSPVWLAGGIIKPDNGVVVTLAGGIASTAARQGFDHSAGGIVVVKKETEVSPHWWGAVGDGVADDTAAIQAAINSQRKDFTTTPCVIRLSAATYKLTDTIDARCTVSGATQWDDFKGFVGAGRNATKIVMHTDNVPIFRISGRYFTVKGFTAKFNNTQSTAQTIGNVFDFEDMVYFCTFDDLIIENGYIGINSKNGEKTDVGSCLFSNTFSNIRFLNNHYMHWRFSAFGGESGGGTGNHMSNIYMSSPSVDRMFRALERFNGFEDVWNQLNIEHTNFEDCAIFDTAGDSLIINGLHLEGVTLFCGSGQRSIVSTNCKGRARIDFGIDHCWFGPRKISGITLSDTTATATVDMLDTTVAHHGFRVGDTVVVDGASDSAYNITADITAVPSVTTFEYTVAGSPASPASLASGVEHMTAWLGASSTLEILRVNSPADTVDMDLRIRDVRVLGKNHGARISTLRMVNGYSPGTRVRLNGLSTRGQVANAHLLAAINVKAVSRTSNVASAYTHLPHKLHIGDSVFVSAGPPGLSGSFTVTGVSGPHQFTYSNPGSDVALASTTGFVMMKTYGTTQRARTGNIATLTLGAHTLIPGQRILVTNIAGGYTASGGTIAILSTTATTISYLSAGSDEETTAETNGVVQLLDAGLTYQFLTEPSASGVLISADWLYSGCEALSLGTVTAGTAATHATTHYGVRVGDRVDWTATAPIPDGLQLQAVATAADTITWRLFNPTAGDIASGVILLRYKFGRG